MHPLLLPLALISSAAQAPPEEAIPEEEIVVTGYGLREAQGDAAFDRVVIDRAALTGSASGQLDEILKQVPGFQLFRRSDARSANPTSQGATLRALGGNASSRALLILDGVPQTDPFGGWINWPAFDPERLGRVRVTRGGGSGANGPGALAGTIELESAAPDELDGLRASLAYGSRDSVDSRAGLGVGLGAGFATVSGSYARGDGFVPIVAEQRGAADRPSPYEQASIAIRGVAPVADDVELQASTLWFRDARERGTAFSGNRTDGIDASLRLVGQRWSALGYVQNRSYRNSFASVDAVREQANQVADQYEVPSTGLGARVEARPELGPVELRLGGDWRETFGRTQELYFFQNGAGTRGRKAGGRTRTLGAYAEAAFEQGPWTLTGGGRIDRWRIEDGFLAETELATGAAITDARFADRSGWEPTGRAGIAFWPGDTVTLRAAAYLGWRLPTLNELYRPFRVGPDATAANAELAPERLRGIEAGAEFRPTSGTRIGATIFANRLSNGIANVTLGEGPGLFPGVGFVGAGGQYRQRRNLDAIAVRGIELDGRIARGPWSLAAGYSFADAEVRASGAALPLDGLRPAQTPRHSLAATLGWDDGDGRRAALTGRYVGGQYEDDLNRDLLPGALTFDAVAAYPLGRRLTLEARAENLANKRVVAAISNGIVERATPRTLWVGLRFGD
jgi:outer membrane receptor protein involved in Fe transport